ncbi:ATP-binding protein [Cryobacterium sp. Y50]|uniref:ATP-binding protein n=1 Tax=Cryobacterium sp. Y50 TaxID=2048286 RepID=UPI000CE54877|nr:ATP-binding protein [Cryobacterium sp. Y50]
MTPVSYTPSLYADVAAMFAGGTPEPPQPTVGRRSDGSGLVYADALNVFFGPPESGKTLAASTIAADTLFDGGSVLVIDIDHNGAHATLARFRSFGVSGDTLSNPARFRYAAPEDAETMRAIVAEAKRWQPTFTILDSIGELLPMFGANSNDADDYTRVNRAVMTALVSSGTALIAIDHEAKGTDSRSYGSSGTAAKKRAVDGAMLRFTVKQPFSPGHGGKASLAIAKDRHGGLKAVSPVGDREPLAAVFQLIQRDGAIDWRFWAPKGNDDQTVDPKIAADALQLDGLDPEPISTRDVEARMHWSSRRAVVALKHWRASRFPEAQGSKEVGIALPASHSSKEGSGSSPQNNSERETS